ncbi:dipeptide ABC transporter ATP-binding protein [Polycladidibacter stylochi]|uniref:dipeptide ABC transporter ATP-binding protein n=1 Tax=Polycladidibacter stylochi TaxID=1807766 RepID=UPI0009E87F99|nr:ABC transporter ATP-binding protein [Pseudovibrio stylochi]
MQHLQKDQILLEFKNLSVEFESSYGANKVLDNISFKLNRQQCLAITGESGSGKTVLSYAILGLLPKNAHITSGQILYYANSREAPVDLVHLARAGELRAYRGRSISMIFQEPMTSLSPLHTLADQIGEVARIHCNASRKQARQLTLEMLRAVSFPNPEQALNTYTFQLSGGLRQRAMIAMALLCKPALLIADEPTTALDVTTQARILKLLKTTQHDMNMSLLLITHDFGIVANMADRALVIYQGKLMEAGRVNKLLYTPRHPYLKNLIAAVPKLHFDSEPLNLESQEHGTPFFQLKNVSVSYEDNKAEKQLALRDVDLTLYNGECLGLVGESGSGKTTLAHSLMAALPVQAGQIIVNNGKAASVLAELTKEQLREFRKNVQLVFQDPHASLPPHMSVAEIISEPLLIHKIGTPKQRQQRLDELLNLIGLPLSSKNRYPHAFSGGQKQRIGIARALACQPRVLICDEPTSALDVTVQQRIVCLLKTIRKQFALTYLIVSHDLAVIQQLADRIAVMCQGRLVEVGPTAAVINQPAHPYTKALLQAVPTIEPDHKMDFAHLAGKNVSSPSMWPLPYKLMGHEKTRMQPLGNGHYVALNEAHMKNVHISLPVRPHE